MDECFYLSREETTSMTDEETSTLRSLEVTKSFRIKAASIPFELTSAGFTLPL